MGLLHKKGVSALFSMYEEITLYKKERPLRRNCQHVLKYTRKPDSYSFKE